MQYNLITTFLENSFSKKNNYYLGKWCHSFDKKKILKPNFKNTMSYHWTDKKKINKDFLYIEKTTEKILVKLSNSLNSIHKTNHDINYWAIIIHPWLVHYISFIFDRWETCRLFVKKNKQKKFIFYDVDFDRYEQICIDHIGFREKTIRDEYNYIIFKRIINFFSPDNISNKKIKYDIRSFKNKQNNNKIISLIALFFADKFLSKLAIKFNSVIIENFKFPLTDYLKLCVSKGLVPAKFMSLFNVNTKRKDKDLFLRNNFKKSFLKNKNINKFENFLLLSICEDLPLSYLENYKELKIRSKKLSNRKKVIITMHSNHWNDFFKIYFAENKLVKSRIIVSDHGGGLHPKLNHYFKFSEKYYDKKLSYYRKKNTNFYHRLPPTLPIIKNKISNVTKDKLTLLITPSARYNSLCRSIPFFDGWIDEINDIINFSKNFDAVIKNKLKFRFKNIGSGAELFGNGNCVTDIFRSIFGDKKVETSNNGATLFQTLDNSKLVITNYPQTSFSECLFLNIPTILISNQRVWQFEKKSRECFLKLKKNKMAFENFRDAEKHIKKIWHDPNSWWQNKNIQKTRQKYLNIFFPVKKKWYEDWSIFLSNVQKKHD
jgi:putative transferase (TIGR04331 family)